MKKSTENDEIFDTCMRCGTDTSGDENLDLCHFTGIDADLVLCDECFAKRLEYFKEHPEEVGSELEELLKNQGI